MPRELIGILWAGWLLYWLLRARDNKTSVRREALSARLPRLVLMLAAAGLLNWPPGRGLLGTTFMPQNSLTAWAGCLVLAAGLAFAIWARIHLGRNWSGRVTVKQDHELIRSGPYGLVRHPIYTGMLLAFVGTSIASGTWASVLATALIVIMLLGKIRLEERWMSEVFPEQYPQYRREVSALIPFLF